MGDVDVILVDELENIAGWVDEDGAVRAITNDVETKISGEVFVGGECVGFGESVADPMKGGNVWPICQ